MGERYCVCGRMLSPVCEDSFSCSAFYNDKYQDYFACTSSCSKTAFSVEVPSAQPPITGYF